MSGILKHTTYETWTVEQLVDATSKQPRGAKKVTIPEFQRRLVWKKNKRDELIASIKRGYPFGTLLMYRDLDSEGNDERYKLIDGLQRTQTLRQYSGNPNSSFVETELPEDLVNAMARNLDNWSDLDCLDSEVVVKLRRSVVQWVWESQGYSEEAGWSASALTEMLLDKIAELEADSYEFYMARKSMLDTDSEYRRGVQSLLDDIKRTSHIGSVEVPVIIYAGPSSELAQIFTLLNTQGIKLTRYEIYAAQWLDYRYRIANPAIIDAVWTKYSQLENHGFELDVSIATPDQQSRLNRHYTLFEYVFGLGQCMIRNYPEFFKSVKPDVPSPVGFNLLSACVVQGVTDRDVRTLPQAIRGLDLSRLEQRVEESVSFVYQLMTPILQSQRCESNKIPYYHTDLQIICMIASAFQVRYSTRDLSELVGWESNRDILGRSLPMHYLRDIMQDSWAGSGDTRLKTLLENQTYLESIPTEQNWQQVLSVWYENRLATNLHSRSYIKDDFTEYLLLRYIMTERLAGSVGFHVKHIVPISRLISPPSYYHDKKGPINTIGNLSIVASEEHVDYGDNTFVDRLKQLQRDGTLGTLRYHDELEVNEKLLLCKASDLPSLEIRKPEFENFLKKRFEILKREFFTTWRDHIPAEPQT